MRVRGNIFEHIAVILVGGLLVCTLLVTIFTFLFSSDVDRMLRKENRLYEQNIPYAEACIAAIKDEAAYLQARDESIYRTVFKVEAPKVESLVSGDILEEDDIDIHDFTMSVAKQAERAGRMADKVEDDWAAVFRILETDSKSLPPLVSPISGLDHSIVGASSGKKINPFYKVSVYHDGIDLVASEGTPVLCTAPGVVLSVERRFGGVGNAVTVSHSGGYLTRYAHLETIAVYRGQRLKRGTLIGTVGDSGRSFTTHLHYGVQRDSLTMDPSYYFYGSLDPDEFARVLVTGASMGQSMD